MTDPTDVESTVTRYCAAWNAHDVDTLLSMQADDMVFHLHLDGAAEVRGTDALREQYAAFFQVMPDYHAEDPRIIVRGDLAVIEYTIAATLAADFPIGRYTGKASTHARFEAVDLLHLKADKITRKDVYVDAFAMRAGWDM
ncbi:nuclear transport factor 2 family protein [Actinokineospora sp. UTMC 2448]|uniref:nuclear transport factor 2 family protein n=1 Tax=Actinokineospora sp. UTMC 2448 TaxID=2268449 RepID=UPI002164EC29|nr:nuclear transport factor 2 family protein [Actinokineospora sp. UTMC 2448]UVS79179.1 putative ester cyclase [Actinokineospora sp. UTMC 2448]